MLAIKSRESCQGYEKLRIICIRALVCHTQQVWLIMFQLEIFVFEGWAVDGLSSRTISFLEISSLSNEIFYYSMKDGAFISKSILVSD